MSDILNMLRNNKIEEDDMNNKDACSIFCLGTGKGATTILHGEPSSSFIVKKAEEPILMVDIGLGVCQSYKKYVKKDLQINRLYVTHNHADHAAELPVLLAVLHGHRKGSHSKLPTVIAAPQVMNKLIQHRLCEVLSDCPQEELADFVTCSNTPSRIPLDDQSEFEMTTVLSQHSETCYGFILYHRGEPMLAYSGDSGKCLKLYKELFQAPNVILDARTSPTGEHAGFEEVEEYIRQNKVPEQQVFILGYGLESEYPVDGVNGATQMKIGESYTLIPAKHLNKSNSIDTSLESLPRTGVTLDYIINNENGVTA